MCERERERESYLSFCVAMVGGGSAPFCTARVPRVCVCMCVVGYTGNGIGRSDVGRQYAIDEQSKHMTRLHTSTHTLRKHVCTQ